jgi:hypothetical protein
MNPAPDPDPPSAYLARLAAERRARPSSKVMRLLDTVPDDDLRRFGRIWNWTCATITVGGLVAVAVIVLAG